MKNQPAINQRYIYLLILVIAGIALWVAVKDLFFFDEDVFVTGNGGVFMQNLWQRSGIVKLTFIADNFLWGRGPAGYHYTNLVLHLINAMLGLLILKQFLKLTETFINEFQQTAIAYIFLILFLISPVHSEPLSYILGRGGSVVALFSLLSILLFLKSNFTNKLFLFFSLLCFLLALLSYEISWMIPFTILSIIVFSAYIKNMGILKKIGIATPYFLVFIGWFIIKVVIIDKMVVTDYKDENLLGISFATLGKNSIVLFLRNFIPPFESSAIFLLISILFSLIFLIGLYLLYKKYRTLFFFCLMLIVITILSFFATIFFGIDSHDSESERYIYFSSVFALMLLSVMLTVLIKNKFALSAIVVALFFMYAISLFNTINGYMQAGTFSKLYLQKINKRIISNETIFFVNIPTQHKGALLFRAKSRIANNTNDGISVMQEYLSYLYHKNNVCITLSAAKLDKVPDNLSVFEKSIDSLSAYFPEVKFDKQNLKIGIGQNDNFPVIKNNTTVIALLEDKIYFFR